MYPTPVGYDGNGRKIAFADVIGNSHRIQVTAQVETPQGRVITQGFGIVGGSVTVDRTAQFRRALSMEVMPYSGSGWVTKDTGVGMTAAQLEALRSSLIPASPLDAMAPYGNLVRLWYGVQVPGYWDSATSSDFYRWSLGAFRIASAQVDDSGTPTLQVTGFDRSRTVSRNKLTQPWIVSAGTNYGDAIIALVQDRDPSAPARQHSVQDTTPALVIDPEQDPWATVTAWGAAIGKEVFFDNEGYLVIRDEPDPSLSPLSWVYADGGSLRNAMLLSVTKAMSDEPGYNGVVMTTESTTIAAPLRSEAWDMNPSSATYSLGAYGKVPKFVSNPYAATQAQLDAAASAELLRSIGGTEQTSLAVIPNPAHEAGDVVQVVRPLSKVNQTALIESMTIPLAATDAMTIQCRERRSLS